MLNQGGKNRDFLSFVTVRESHIFVHYSHAIRTFGVKLSCVYYGFVKVTLSPLRQFFPLEEGRNSSQQFR